MVTGVGNEEKLTCTVVTYLALALTDERTQSNPLSFSLTHCHIPFVLQLAVQRVLRFYICFARVLLIILTHLGFVLYLFPTPYTHTLSITPSVLCCISVSLSPAPLCPSTITRLQNTSGRHSCYDPAARRVAFDARCGSSYPPRALNADWYAGHRRQIAHP